MPAASAGTPCNVAAPAPPPQPHRAVLALSRLPQPLHCCLPCLCAQALEREYGIETVYVETHIEGCGATANGTRCSAYAFDAGRPRLCKEDGLVEAAGVPPIMTVPFALTVAKNNTALYRRVAAAVLETMRVSERVRPGLAAPPACAHPCSAAEPPSPAHPPPPTTATQDGDASVILEWEKRYVTDAGALSNPELARVVQAMSYFQ